MKAGADSDEFIKMNKTIYALLAAGMGLLTAPAVAGTLADNLWNSARCGSRPLVVSVDLRDAEAYNQSLEKVNVYQREINRYLDCLVAEGNSDIQLITKVITTEQLAALKDREKLLADVDKASKKFDAK